MMKEFYVYVLYSEKFDRSYTGMTSNLVRRVKEHNQKMNKSTRTFVPWKLIYCEKFQNRLDARDREKYLKSGSGREFLRIILNSYIKKGSRSSTG